MRIEKKIVRQQVLGYVSIINPNFFRKLIDLFTIYLLWKLETRVLFFEKSDFVENTQ